ncbi:MAG: hypothetical protein CMJ58_16865 [Planctomycetaceae bacterium]|nr:hypothetical protein [Planctomycetaceae bacterium]
MHSVPTATWRSLLDLPANPTALAVCTAFAKFAVDALAPRDFRGIPFYAMPLSSLPDRLTDATAPTFAGWYSDLTYFWIRESLPQDRGPGPTVVTTDVVSREATHDLARKAQIVYAAMGEDVPIEELEEIARDTSVDLLCEILTHELAHAVVSLVEGEFDCWAEVARRKKGLPFVESRLNSLAESTKQNHDPGPQLDCHGPRFVRTHVHLAARLRRRGLTSFKIRWPEHNYGHRPFEECYAALVDETDRRSDQSFAKILSTRGPRAFLDCCRQGDSSPPQVAATA